MAKKTPEKRKMSKDTLEFLREITSVNAVPGYEGAAVALLKKRLGRITEVETDRAGNVFFTLKGAAARRRIVLPAHLDEVGLMVKFVDEKGFIRFHTLGGWWSQVLLAQRVNVINSRGRIFPGVVGSKPPHLLSQEERDKVVKLDDLFIDIGASSQREVEKDFGIVPGDPIVPDAPFTVMAGGKKLLAKAWDDRAGAAVMALALEALKGTKHPNTVIGCGTVQEEVGLRGAKTVPATADPDIALVMEVGITGDSPGIKPEEARGGLGKGPMFCILDARMIPNRGLRDFIVNVAEKARIPYQFMSIPGGATDGGELQHTGRGVPSLYIGVPCRYVHAHHGIIDCDDFEDTVRLIVEVLRRFDEKALREVVGEGTV